MWRGTLLHEVLHLPAYWRMVDAAAQLSVPVHKLTFGDHSRQYCLIVRPPTAPRAWVLYWHGGGWQYGTPEQFIATAQAFVTAGYGVVLPSYRRLPRYRFAAIRRDTINMLAAVKNYWGQAQESPQSIILLGMSAGGHLASLVGLDPEITASATWPRENIKGVVTCGGVLDFSVMKYNAQLMMLAGVPGNPFYRAADPMTYLPGEAPPFLLLHGTRDGMVPYAAAQNFEHCFKEQSQDRNCQLITLSGGTHLDAARWMFDPDSELSRQVFAWIQQRLP